MTHSSLPQRLLRYGQYVSGMIAAVLLSSLIPIQYQTLSVAAFSFAALGISYDQLKLHAESNPGLAKAFISVTSIGLLMVNLVSIFVDPSLISTTLSLFTMVALLMLVQMFARCVPNSRLNQLLALIGIVVSTLTLIVRLVALLEVGSWVLIGGLGIGLILLASLYERFGATLTLPSTSANA